MRVFTERLNTAEAAIKALKVANEERDKVKAQALVAAERAQSARIQLQAAMIAEADPNTDVCPIEIQPILEVVVRATLV